MSIQKLHNTNTTIPSRHFPELLFVEDQLQLIFNKAEGLIHQTCISLLQAGGKRIRPLLTLYSGMCFAPLTPLMLKSAVAAELIHMASLIHDDVIDESATRRGEPTVSAQHGNHKAILTGDYLFAEAFNILSTHQLQSSMNYFIEAIQAMCEGEVNQADQHFSSSLDKQHYFDLIAKKTGILLAACCQSGSSLAGVSSEVTNLMREYGLNIGYAYQITDDILDISGDADSLGKPVGVDLMNGNITLPILYLLDNPIYGNWLREILNTRKITLQGSQSLKEALICSGSIEQAYSTASKCIENAKACLDKVPSSTYKAALLELADSILHRTN